MLNNKAYFVTLNYDRSLEEFLFRGMCSEWYKTPRDQLERIAHDFVTNRIVHLHGHLGPLKWQDGSGTRYAGSPSTMDQIGQMASRLLIATEAADDQNEYLKAKGWLEKACRIHFIGYGYHGDQLRRLRPQSVKVEAEDRISGTYRDVDDSHCRQLEDRSPFGYKINLAHGFKLAENYAKNMLHPAEVSTSAAVS